MKTSSTRAPKTNSGITTMKKAILACCIVIGMAGTLAVTQPAANADDTFSITPVQGPVAGGTQVTLSGPTGVKFTAVGQGEFVSEALGDDGNIYAWGDNAKGQLGTGGTPTFSATPLKVQAPSGVTFTSFEVGDDATVAHGSDGNWYVWGFSAYGSINGDGSTLQSDTPIKVEPPAGVTYTSVTVGADHFIALGDDGNVYGWGDNAQGQLGTGGTSTFSATPLVIPTPAGVTFNYVQASLGNSSFAIDNQGDGYAWGWNYQSALGIGGSDWQGATGTPTLMAMPSGVTFSTIAAGNVIGAAIGSDGNTYTWGNNDEGELGQGIPPSANEGDNHFSTPAQVLAPAGVTFTMVSAGVDHMVALGSDGNAYAWGNGDRGELGDGGKVDSDIPVKVQSPQGVTFTDIKAGCYATIALGSDGNAYVFGEDNQSYDGKQYIYHYVPQLVEAPQVVVNSVAFDGVAGTDLQTTATAGNWLVTTPAHASGTVPVTVSWTLGGVVQPPATLSFTYLDSYAITFDSQGGSEVPGQTVTEGDTIVKPSDPTKDGYTFAGWSTTPDGSSGVYDFSTPPTGNVTLYAQWTLNQVPPDTNTQPGETLAQTGSPVLGVLLAAGVLVALAAVLMVVKRRTV